MRFLVLLHGLFFSTLLFGQNWPVIDWNNKYGDFGTEVAHEVIQTMQGHIVMVGQTKTLFSHHEDGYLVILNTEGSILKEKKLGYKKNDILYAIVETYDGGYVMAGYSDAGATTPRHIGKKDAWLIKTDEHGKVLWDKLLGTVEDDVFYDVAQDLDGNIIATGHFGQQLCLVKLSAQGQAVWEKTYAGQVAEIGRALYIEQSGAIALTGYKTIGNTHQCILLKASPKGQQVWKKYFPQSKGLDLYKDSDAYWITGVNQSLKKRDNMYILKANNHGDKISSYSYGDVFEDAAHCFLSTTDKRYFIAGYTYPRGERRTQLWLHQIGKYGQAVWEDNFYLGGVQYDEANDLIQLQDGSLLLAGYSSSEDTKQKDAWLVKMEAPSLPETDNIPLLSLSEGELIDESQNHTLDPNERAYYTYELSNISDVDAHQIVAQVQLNKDAYNIDYFAKVHLGYLAAGTTKKISIPIQAAAPLQNKENMLSVQIQSANGATLPPQKAWVTSEEAPQSDLKIIAHQFRPVDGSVFKREQKITLRVEIKNQGKKTAEGLRVFFHFPNQVEAINNNVFHIESLAPEASQVLQFDFKATDIYRGEYQEANKVNIYCRVAERLKQQQLKDTFSLILNQELITSNERPSTKPNSPNPDFTTITWLEPNPHPAGKKSQTEWEFTNPELKIKVKAKSSQVLKDENFSIIVNEKIYPTGKYEVVSQAGANQIFTFESTIFLQEGENRVYVKVQNDAGIDSTITLTYQPEKIKLYILSIGVPYDNLAYTTKDAIDFARAFQGQKKGLFKQIETRVLNTKPLTTNQNIKDEIEKLTSRYDWDIQERDMVMLFISSHGRYDKYEDKLRLISSDFDDLPLNTRTIEVKRDILEPFTQLNCKKLLFIDACQSGGIIGSKNSNPIDAALIKALKNMAKAEKSIRMMVSCNVHERSYEDKDWENGAFTEAILAALNAETVKLGKEIKKANQDNDSILTLDELYHFVHAYVPHLVQTKKKQQQHPYFSAKDKKEDLPVYFYEQ